MNLPDQADRTRFAADTGKNFSVIAPAGVGKTTAIAARVLQIAREDAAVRERARERRAPPPVPRLPKLVVATYTRKAADEMRDRARSEIVRAGLPAWVLGQFNEAYFGTIHSFCFELLRRFGPLAGLPTRFVLEQDDAVLQLAFQRDTPDVAAFLPEKARAVWRRYGLAENIWKLAWEWPAEAVKPGTPGPCPVVDLTALFNFQREKKNKKSEEKIRQARERLRRWQTADTAARALGVPRVAGGGEDFEGLWAETFQPLRNWLAAAAAKAAAQLAEAYADFKERSGRIGYDDFVRPALRLLRDPALAARIRAQEFSVLLDEAQDTDPAQFAVLVGVAQPVNGPGLWTDGNGAPPAPGRFSMVGDPQQSIYARGDVRAYKNLHDRLVQAGAAEALEFSVTMRCDEKIVSGANAVFPALLNERPGQAKFVPLSARPGAGAGGVWRLPVAPPAGLDEDSDKMDLLRAEAKALARWLKTAGVVGAGADDWAQVAVLAPRRKWLGVLAAALREAGVPAQLHADDRARGADPARTWLGALLGVIADPEDLFETAGVLREIFGISDDEIYRWRKSASGAETPSLNVALALLRQIQRHCAGLALRDAVALVVEATQLAERLRAIGAAPETLGALLDQAVLADGRGDNLAAFARQLRSNPAEAAGLIARPGEIQLLTSHKAKGLEWQAVILFGLWVEPEFPPPKYPCWRAPAAPGEPPACLYDKYQAAGAAGEVSASSLREAENVAAFERLLYVSATRPRHTLLLVDSSALPAKDKMRDGSLADVLGVREGGPARGWWEGLPEAGTKIGPQKKNEKAKVATPVQPAHWPDAPAWTESLEKIRAKADGFTRRVLPSSLARHGAVTVTPEHDEPDLFIPPEYPEAQPLPASAVDYGNWWHGVMEHTPWPAGKKTWEKFWDQQCAEAPEPERARAEMEKLKKSPLAEKLSAPRLEFVAEMPFLWAEQKGARAFDGCLDLAVWDATAARWLVIDWKTDRVEGDPAAELRQRYGPQVEVYAHALTAMTGAPVETFLYSTRTGVLINV